MFEQLLDRIQKAPAKLNERKNELSNRAKLRINRTQGDSRERLWELGVSALEHAETVLESADTLPVISKLTDKGSAFVSSRLDAATGLTIENYEELTAKQVIRAIGELDNRIELARVRRYETNGKGRKTVLDAIDRAVTKWNRRFVEPVTA